MRRVRWLLLFGVFFASLSVFAWSAVNAGSGTDVLQTGEWLDTNEYLITPNGDRILIMQEDGNLVLRGAEVERQLWQSGTSGNPGAYYQMQDDGNFVVYSEDGSTQLWASGTDGNPGSGLVMENDGNLIVYSPPKRTILWQSDTGGNPGAYYTMQDDGNFVVYSEDGSTQLWASGTEGNPGAELLINDGNLSVFSAANAKPVWSSQTDGNPGAELVMQNDGNLVIYSVDGPALWATNTGDWIGPRYNYEMEYGELRVMRLECTLLYLIEHCFWRTLWGSGTAGIPDTELIMQDDGNLVIYSSAASKTLWETGTGGNPDSELVMEDDGNLVLYGPTEPQVLWESGTAGDDHDGAELFMREDGNLVIRMDPMRKAIWASNTDGHPGAELVMQNDGNLVIYSVDGTPLWATRTNGGPNPHLKLESDGNLVIYWDTELRWQTDTYMPWMEKLGGVIEDFSIRKLAIPGTHDSGTYGLVDSQFADDNNVSYSVFKADGFLPWHVEIHTHWVEHHTSWWPHLPYWTLHFDFTPHAKYFHSFATTQGPSIYEQLHNGIRYIDMRVLYDNDHLYLIHTLKGPDVFDTINSINHFLRENPYEVVILDFNHFYTDNGSGSTIPDDWNHKLINHIQNTMGDLLIAPANVNDLTMNDIWLSGKQAIVFYSQSGPNKDNFWPTSKLRSEWLDEQSWWSGAGKSGLETQMDEEATCVRELSDGCDKANTQLWVMQGILTFNPGVLGEYLYKFEWDDLWAWVNGNKSAAESVNTHVRDWVLNGSFTEDLNILLGDWAAEGDLVQTAIQLNLKKAGLDYVDHGIEGLPLNMSEPESPPSSHLEATAMTIPDVIPAADIRLEATGQLTTVDLGEGAAYDYIDGWLETTHNAAGMQFPIGTHSVTWSSSDAANVTGTSTQTVRIVSHSPGADKNVLWPPNHKMSTVAIHANVVSGLQGLVTLSAFVTSNEPVEGKGDGDKTPDWGEPKIDQKKGIIRIPLRAERSGLGNDRVYTVKVVATDNEGNQSEEFVYIDVKKN